MKWTQLPLTFTPSQRAILAEIDSIQTLDALWSWQLRNSKRIRLDPDWQIIGLRDYITAARQRLGDQALKVKNVKFDEELCLTINPFDGDYGEQSDVVLSNRIVTAVSSTACDQCGKKIKYGERIRAMTGVYDGMIKHYRFCNRCCVEMVKDYA